MKKSPQISYNEKQKQDKNPYSNENTLPKWMQSKYTKKKKRYGKDKS